MQTPFTLMVQGTTSDAGKSTLVAGMGRVLARNNQRVVPFKPQNMALNSAVTPEGGEIGRAQALQAQACFMDPHVDMNPVLIKPSSDTGAQIIVSGKALSNMDAKAFHAFKPQALNHVLSAYNRLKKQADIVLVEGAGSPAEINLREGDIANMGFAQAADCPVIIIADIDKGGVFAHLVGTLDLLSQSEQNRVIGFVINRFRGDIALLQSGLDWLEHKTGKPVLGVIPYLHGLYLDAEDAIDAKQPPQENSTLKICVLVLPRISNHTDFDSLRLHPQVDLKYIHIEHALPNCDLLILPGSKNTRSDCTYIKKYNWPKKIQKHLRYGGKLLGICGGYQILGHTIIDKEGIEDTPGITDGLGYIPMQTTLIDNKQLINIKADLTLKNDSGNVINTHVNGYEIHCGISEFNPINTPTCTPINNKTYAQPQETKHMSTNTFNQRDGFISEDNQIFGTYIHGLFDQPKACQALLHWAGLIKPKTVDINVIREKQLNRLADTYEQHLNFKTLNHAIQQFYERGKN